MSGWSLLEGPLPIVVVGVGMCALGYLFLRPSMRWWLLALLAAGFAALVAFGGAWLVVNVFSLVPEKFPTTVVAAVAVGLWAVILACTTAIPALGARRRRRVFAVMAALLVVAAASIHINSYFGSVPTVASLIRPTSALPEGLPEGAIRPEVERFMGTPVTARWSSQAMSEAALPAVGEFRSATIPGTVSGFVARNAVVYLPPAYFAPQRPVLPVLVLVSGQPGSPQGWLESADLRGALDSYSREHQGIAPVVVIPDPNGSDLANTMCMDSTIAKADSYMSVDVPNWITSSLDVDSNHAHWAIGGYSFGGTCAVQMATRHPSIYPTFAAFSPEREPALAMDRAVTVKRAFNGDDGAFAALLPLTLLAERSYPQSHGWFAAGASDPVHLANAEVLAGAASQAGMTIEQRSYPGTHSWAVVNTGLQDSLDFLGDRLGTQ